MAKKIQAWTEFGPRLEPATPLGDKELVEQITVGSNESMSSVLSVLTFMDAVMEQALKAGRIIQLPNGTHFRPIGKKDGSIEISVRVNPDLVKRVNAEFRGKWQNAQNIGKEEADMIALWNAAHPEDLIEV
ncbi:MAG: hypothetical protein HYZ25_05775 [Chloroflexi bacterium]|nr:hypothetical protein [Chloroflexota bacterium]